MMNILLQYIHHRVYVPVARRAEAQDALHVVARVRRIGHQHIMVGHAPRCHHSIEVFVPVVDGREAQLAEMPNN